jgi:hypothetical protein
MKKEKDSKKNKKNIYKNRLKHKYRYIVKSDGSLYSIYNNISKSLLIIE